MAGRPTRSGPGTGATLTGHTRERIGLGTNGMRRRSAHQRRHVPQPKPGLVTPPRHTRAQLVPLVVPPRGITGGLPEQLRVEAAHQVEAGAARGRLLAWRDRRHLAQAAVGRRWARPAWFGFFPPGCRHAHPPDL
eukprot:scaffold9834_cov105-Isochrysis_galbana.AAC.5